MCAASPTASAHRKVRGPSTALRPPFRLRSAQDDDLGFLQPHAASHHVLKNHASISQVRLPPHAQAPVWARLLSPKLQLRAGPLGQVTPPVFHPWTKQSFADIGMTKRELGHEGNVPTFTAA